MQPIQVAQILFCQSPYFSHYKNENQKSSKTEWLQLSIDIIAIDSEDVELGAQHKDLQCRKGIYKIWLRL
jgi:putative lipoic acid-binding regulatory protein